MATQTTPTGPWNPTAVAATWLLPGLGHFLVGERRRGKILMTTIGLVWGFGILFGGITVVDHRDHPAWFLGQMLTAPSVAVNILHQSLRKNLPSPPTPADATYEPSFGQVYEQGMLYTLLAGLLNLLAMMDVAHRPTNPAPQGDLRKAGQT